MFSTINVILIRRCSSRKLLNCSFSSSLRPLAKFEQIVEDYLDKNKERQKQLPGVFNTGSTVILPERLKEAVDTILNSSSDTNLYQNAKILNNHLVFKKPPLTENQLKEIESACAAKLAETHPLPFGK